MSRKDTDYLHASARVSYLENKLLSKDEMLKAADSANVREAYRILSSKGIFADHEVEDYEKALEESMTHVYELMEEITEGSGITYVFRYYIDGHNLKVMIKDKLAEDDFTDLYRMGGTVKLEMLKAEFGDKTFYHTPQKLGDAALEAVDTLAKTRNPQSVDIIIDKAVLELMSDKAKQLKIDSLVEYVMMMIDLINVSSALRLLRMKKDTFKAAKVFAAGGSFTIKELKEAYSMGYDGIGRLLEKSYHDNEFGEAVLLIKEGKPMSVFQRQIDRCFEKFLEKIRNIPFGIESVLTYLYLKTREVRACRLVIASKFFDLPKDKVIQMVRGIYAD